MDSPSAGNQPHYPPHYRSPRAVAENFRNDFSMRPYLAGSQLYGGGRHQNALMAFRYGLERDPAEFRLHMMVIMTYMCLRKKEEAERQLAKLRDLHPSEEIARTITDLIGRWQYVPDSVGELPVGPGAEPAITMSLLGLDGQFGNQVFQYAYSKLYAEKFGLRFESYDWIGRRLFGLWDPDVSRILPFVLEIEYLRDDPFSVPPAEQGVLNRDTQGYFQFPTKVFAPYRGRFLSFFKPVSAVAWALRSFLSEIRSGDATLVAIHLRLGDAAGQGRNACVRNYVEWLNGLWPTLKNPVLYLASDDLEAVRGELQAFRPITSERVGLPMAGMDFYPDFHVMTQADYLAAGNSTFSFAAAMLNERAKAFVRPDSTNSRLVPFDPWDAAPIL